MVRTCLRFVLFPSTPTFLVTIGLQCVFPPPCFPGDGVLWVLHVYPFYLNISNVNMT